MKALSLRQPWAWAVIYAGKDIENRTWRTHYRGWIAVHATATVQREWSMPRGARAPRLDALVRSAIVGVALLTDVVESSRSKWFDGVSYGWMLERPRALMRPIPCTGRLGIWTVPPAVAAQVMRQLGRLAEPKRSHRRTHGHADEVIRWRA